MSDFLGIAQKALDFSWRPQHASTLGRSRRKQMSRPCVFQKKNLNSPFFHKTANLSVQIMLKKESHARVEIWVNGELLA
jgi:hypothetical protein